MALGANALITFAYAQGLFGFAAADQTKVETLIDAASAVANLYTHRALAAADHTETLDGTGKTNLILPQFPVNSVASLYVDTDRSFGATTAITDYQYYTDGEIYYAGGFPDIRKCVKVTWNAGYTISSTVPDDIQIAIAEIVQWYLSKFDGDGVGISAIQNPDGIVSRYERDLPYSARQRLGPYKRVR